MKETGFRKAPKNLIDFMIVGEGEKPLVELLNHINSTSTDPVNISGVVDCRTQNGMELRIPCDPLDLSHLSFPDYGGFNLSLYTAKVAAVMWSRGCISTCAFCKEKSLWDRYRMRTVDNILEEIRFYREKDINEFVIFDSLVNGNPRHLEELCDAIISREMSIRWSALAIPNKRLTPELLKKMKQAGCFVLIFGLESGSEKILKLMRKGFLLDDAVQVIKDTKAVGIKTAINIMVGFPGELRDDFEKTLSFIRDYKEYIDRVDAVTPLQLVHGTYLMNHRDKFGIKLLKERMHECWETADGLNNYDIRFQRCRTTVDLCRYLGIEIGKTFIDENKEYIYDMLFMNINFPELPDYDTASVVEYLRQCGITAVVIYKHTAPGQLESILRELENIKFRFMAVKIVESNHGEAIEFIHELDSRDINEKIVLWGSACRTEGQRKDMPLEQIECIIFQEYERNFQNFIRAYRHGNKSKCVPGVYFLDKKYIPSTLVKDITNFPFPRYDSLNFVEFRTNRLPIRLSKGCPHRCSFCSTYYEDGPYRVREAEAVFSEIKYHFDKNGIQEFVFQDRSICGNPEILQCLCDMIIESGLDVIWEAKYIAQHESCGLLLQKMAESGCSLLDFGFISASDRILELMGKPFNANLLETSLRKAKKKGIRTRVSLLVGFPGEDESEFKETVLSLWKNSKLIDEVKDISTCFIRPGCSIEIAPQKYNIILPKTNYWREWHNGLNNNFSYRLKKQKELAIFLSGIGLISDLTEFVNENDEINNFRDRIYERFISAVANHEEKNTSGRCNGIPDEPVIAGIISENEIYAGPEVLEIDLTNNCNLQCIGCWCHSPLLGDDRLKGGKKRTHLPTNTILSLLNEAKEMGTKEVQLSGTGEPFLHPEIWKILEKSKDLELSIKVITNFTLLNESGMRNLVEMGIDNLTVSVWAGDSETYQRTHPGVPKNLFDRLKHSLKQLTSIRKEYGSPKVKLYHVINKENAHNITSMVDLAFRVAADDVEFQMVDIVEGKTDSLKLGPNETDIVLQQFQSIHESPNFTEEFKGEEHLKILNDEHLENELSEFGRLHYPLPTGFKLSGKGKGLLCPKGIGGQFHRKTEERIEFIFPIDKCRTCSNYIECTRFQEDEVRVEIRLINLLGVGSFLRRLSSSHDQNQQYERSIIDKTPCTIGWTYARVRVNGDVIPCCKAVTMPMGNIYKDSFSKVWRSSVYSEFRQKSKELPKKDPYFHNINCYKSCDNLGMNINTHLKLQKYLKGKEK